MVPGILKNQRFWVGFAVGTVVGPVILHRFAPGMKAKLPAQS